MRPAILSRGIADLTAPVLMQLLYLTFSRWPVGWANRTIDGLALALSLGTGAALIGIMPVLPLTRTCVVVVYVPVVGAALFYLMFVFLAVIHGNAL